MLTVTPYNKHYKDLSAQLRLFIGDDTDLGICPEAYIRQIGGERAFSEKHDGFNRNIKAFEHSDCQEDWQELMRLSLSAEHVHLLKITMRRPTLRTTVSI